MSKIRFVLTALVAVTVVLAGCCPKSLPTSTVVVTERGTTVASTTAAKPSPAAPGFTCNPLKPSLDTGFDPTRYALSEAGLYLDGLVTVTGVSEPGGGDVRTHVDAVMQQVWGMAGPPAYIDEILLDGLVIRLYDYTDNDDLKDLTVWEVVLAIYLAALQQGVNVYGDPDYLLGDPWDVQGSPWDVQGSPWDVQGSPWATVEQVEDLYIESLFWKQWAFADEPYGISLDPQSGGGSRMQLAVFDTSPFWEAGPYVFDLEGANLQLCVSHPVAVVAPQGSHDYREHGLAVAGLAHAVAPESTIDLVKVLNDNAEGDLFTLLKSMSMFLQKVLDERGYTIMDEHTLINVVINLSLGFRPEQSDPPNYLVYLLNSEQSPSTYLTMTYQVPDELQEPLQGWTDLDEGVKATRIEALRGKLELVEGEAIPVPALRFLIRFATDRGAVVVAAAGNEHLDVAQRPALWPEVIGVGASNISARRSCYSNVGDVYAPGGDGDGSCTSQLQECADAPYAECSFGVISLVSSQDPKSAPGEGVTAHQYAYWAGTSFSTPMVSGLVALHGISSQGVPSLIRDGELAEVLGTIHVPPPAP
jgi:hypothetical protein